jgi:hypothetical protein
MVAMIRYGVFYPGAIIDALVVVVLLADAAQADASRCNPIANIKAGKRPMPSWPDQMKPTGQPAQACGRSQCSQRCNQFSDAPITLALSLI